MVIFMVNVHFQSGSHWIESKKVSFGLQQACHLQTGVWEETCRFPYCYVCPVKGPHRSHIQADPQPSTYSLTSWEEEELREEEVNLNLGTPSCLLLGFLYAPGQEAGPANGEMCLTQGRCRVSPFGAHPRAAFSEITVVTSSWRFHLHCLTPGWMISFHFKANPWGKHRRAEWLVQGHSMTLNGTRLSVSELGIPIHSANLDIVSWRRTRDPEQ